MLKPLSIFIMLQFLACSLYSQINFVPGYIIDLQGDTLNGYIDYRDRNSSPEEINYRQNKKGKATKYFPKDIQKFSVADKFYTSAEVEINKSFVKTAQLESDSIIRTTISHVFLQALIVGEKSLFLYTYTNGIDNFYILNGNKYKLLKHKIFLKRVGDIRVKSQRRNYRLQLREYFKDCPSIFQEIQKTEFTKNELVRLFNSFYKTCASNKPLHKIKKGKLKWNLGVMNGASLTSLKFNLIESKTNAYDHLTKANFKTSINYTASIYAELVFPKKRGKWSLYNELQYSKFSAQGKYDDIRSEEFYFLNTTNIAYSESILVNMIRYKHFIKSHSLIYLNAGLSTGSRRAIKNERNIESRFYSSFDTEQAIALKYLNSFNLGPVAGVGFQFKKFIVEFRYAKKGIFTNINVLNADLQQFSILAGYQFYR